MDILTADETDIEKLTLVEIESKRQSIPDCIEAHDVDFTSRLYRWQTYFKRQSPQTARPERLVLKAVEDGHIIGYLSGHFTTRFGLDAEIQSFYILKPAQHQKNGSKLLAAFTEWLIDMKAKTLCVGIHPKNRYQQFYRKYGGQYLNEHWIYWPDIPELRSRLRNAMTGEAGSGANS